MNKLLQVNKKLLLSIFLGIIVIFIATIILNKNKIQKQIIVDNSKEAIAHAKGLGIIKSDSTSTTLGINSNQTR